MLCLFKMPDFITLVIARFHDGSMCDLNKEYNNFMDLMQQNAIHFNMMVI